MNVIGLMSGTSLDGLDIAFVSIEENIQNYKMHAFLTVPFPSLLLQKIKKSIESNSLSAAFICSLNFEISYFYADAIELFCEKFSISHKDIDLIGTHGQTVHHQPLAEQDFIRSTLQLGEPSILVEKFNCPVVSNFRSMDIAAGGQGAPLVAYVDNKLFSEKNKHIALLNIGGISNVTSLFNKETLAYDCGPGNMIIDYLCMYFYNQPYDEDGFYASKGQINENLLNSLLNDSYFELMPPKTTGREKFGKDFCNKLLETHSSIQPNDFITTATYFTAKTISQSFLNFLPSPIDHLIISGGGAYNKTLLNYLSQLLPNVKITNSDVIGISAESKEAVYFSLLAFETFMMRPNNLPQATGAQKKVILGSITYNYN